MDTKQIVMILLIIAIIFSVISVVISLGVDSDYVPVCRGAVGCPGDPDDTAGGEVSLVIEEPPGGTG